MTSRVPAGVSTGGQFAPGARQEAPVRLSTLEVAECLDVSEDVVKTRLSRGRALLRQLLMERTGAVAPEAFRFYRPRCDRVVAGVLATIVSQPSSLT